MMTVEVCKQRFQPLQFEIASSFETNNGGKGIPDHYCQLVDCKETALRKGCRMV
jgi:hypothetical protein